MKITLIITSVLSMFCSQSCFAEERSFLHVSSPDWSDQVIYFVLTDRFNDGDKTNNDQGAGEYDQKNNQKYSGGDIKGVIDKIPYLKELGVTTVWITPVVANQWWDPWSQNAGYHGYWAENFKKVDKHLGDLDTYKKLSQELHKNGMYLVQDVVCNHVGNFFRYNGTYDPKNVTQNFELNLDSKPVHAPSQYPFNLNDARDPKQRAMNVYNWTPNITNYNDPKQKSTYQMSDLDDLNTLNPLVRKALDESFKYWIKEAGVDAFRVDTAAYVEHDFWRFFNPSIESFAKGLGKKDFLIFAETWFNAEPNNTEGDDDTARYLGSKQQPEFNSIINFPMQNDVERVFGGGAPTSFLSFRIKSMYNHYKKPERLVNFIDNHDMSRFLASYKKDSFIQALTFIMTIPGIPSIYYGSEQGFKTTRSSMFAKGVGSEGKDHFDTDSEYFKLIQSLVSMRKTNSFFRKGRITVLKDSKTEAGAFVYKVQDERGTGLVIFNTASVPILMDNLNTRIDEGSFLDPVFSYNSKVEKIQIDHGGVISRILPPHSIEVLALSKRPKDKIIFPVENIKVSKLFRSSRIRRNFILDGTYQSKDDSCKLSLVIDGNFRDAIEIVGSKDQTWKVEVPVDNFGNGDHSLVVVSTRKDNAICAGSDNIYFNVYRPYDLVTESDDKVGDDKGPKGTYLYPTHETFKGQMDLKKVKVLRSGNNVLLKIKMANPTSNSWNPKNGFDHVTFSIYLEVPGDAEGTRVMPYQNSLLPEGMKWNFMAYIAGWSNAFYSSSKSSKKSFGTPVNPGPDVSVDKADNTINVAISARSIGLPKDLKGMKIYVSTWDYDGLESKYRPLGPKPESFSFGGGLSGDPLVMDDTAVLIINN